MTIHKSIEGAPLQSSSFTQTFVFNTRGHVACCTLDLYNSFISGQSTYNRLIHVHWTGSKKANISEQMKTIYNILRADCVYSVIFIHNPILSLDNN